MPLPKNNYSIICYGEILWDVLPTGTVPGGAPMNVAYHLKKLGLNPALITRVGLDSPGNEIINVLAANKISTEFCQFDDELATGKVIATAGKDNEVVYDIIKPAAWDNIQWDDNFENLLSNARYFVFGSLITRYEQSRNTLYRLLEMARYKILDINLRPPHYTRQIIEHLLKNINLLKLNLAELELITGWFTGYKNETDRIKILHERFDIPAIVVTRGGDGSLLSINGEVYEHAGYKVNVADTVGSGDASLAALMAKLLDGYPPDEALAFSGALGALVASYNGACPHYNIAEIYQLMNVTNFQKL